MDLAAGNLPMRSQTARARVDLVVTWNDKGWYLDRAEFFVRNAHDIVLDAGFEIDFQRVRTSMNCFDDKFLRYSPLAGLASMRSLH